MVLNKANNKAHYVNEWKQRREQGRYNDDDDKNNDDDHRLVMKMNLMIMGGFYTYTLFSVKFTLALFYLVLLLFFLQLRQ